MVEVSILQVAPLTETLRATQIRSEIDRLQAVSIVGEKHTTPISVQRRTERKEEILQERKAPTTNIGEVMRRIPIIL